MAVRFNAFRITSFNPRTHTGATPCRLLSACLTSFQSTHPYGCDHSENRIGQTVLVSIHAPIRVRRAFVFRIRKLQDVSIHAPIRVRQSSSRSVSSISRFNPRTHTGATSSVCALFWARMFQSTHPYGCDCSPRMTAVRYMSFNPRTHTGATEMGRDSGAHPAVSIHAPIRVRRGFGSFFQLHFSVSIHAPIRVRPLGYRDGDVFILFQSTHPYGCDGHEFDGKPRLFVSIHAPIRVRRPDSRVAL